MCRRSFFVFLALLFFSYSRLFWDFFYFQFIAFALISSANRQNKCDTFFSFVLSRHFFFRLTQCISVGIACAIATENDKTICCLYRKTIWNSWKKNNIFIYVLLSFVFVSQRTYRSAHVSHLQHFVMQDEDDDSEKSVRGVCVTFSLSRNARRCTCHLKRSLFYDIVCVMNFVFLLGAMCSVLLVAMIFKRFWFWLFPPTPISVRFYFDFAWFELQISN